MDIRLMILENLKIMVYLQSDAARLQYLAQDSNNSKTLTSEMVKQRMASGLPVIIVDYGVILQLSAVSGLCGWTVERSLAILKDAGSNFSRSVSR